MSCRFFCLVCAPEILAAASYLQLALLTAHFKQQLLYSSFALQFVVCMF
jgi:hypothetical protein